MRQVCTSFSPPWTEQFLHSRHVSLSIYQANVEPFSLLADNLKIHCLHTPYGPIHSLPSSLTTFPVFQCQTINYTSIQKRVKSQLTKEILLNARNSIVNSSTNKPAYQRTNPICRIGMSSLLNLKPEPEREGYNGSFLSARTKSN